MSNEQVTQTQAQSPATTSPKRTFQTLVDSEQFKSQIKAALPEHLTPERFIRVLMTATIKNPQLLECTQESMFKAIFDCAAIGLELDGRRAHLIPLRNRQKQGQPLEANLWLDYKGIAELAMRSGVVSNIHADTVCERDEFEVDRGQIVKHRIDYRHERGEMYAAYCIIRMKDGGEKCEVMTKHEIDAIRLASPGANASPWKQHYPEMAKKTVFKRASKWVPLSAEILNVIDAENDQEPVNVTPKKTFDDVLGGGAPASALPSAAATDAPAPVTDVVTEPAKEYSPQEREAILKELESLMLDNGVSESKVMLHVHANKLAREGQDEVSTLDSGVLDELRAVVPTLKKKAAAK